MADEQGAVAILVDAADQIGDRADQRDCAGGERSMARTVATFNALTGHQLTEVDGWQFMQCLKLARSRAGRHVRDDYVDNAAYAALAGEAADRALNPGDIDIRSCRNCGRSTSGPFSADGRCIDCA
jgi:hypothetical protein